MSKIRLIMIGLMIAINSFAVVVTDPQNYTFHVSDHDTLWGGQNVGENVSYEISFSPDIPNYSIIAELFFKLNFSSTPNLHDVVSIASCDNAHYFNTQNLVNVFKRTVIDDSVYLVYNYVDDRVFNAISNLNCWNVITKGEVLSSLHINITYHQSDPNDVTLVSFNALNGYTNSDVGFTGKNTLSVISQSDLVAESGCTFVNGSKISVDNKKSENLVILIHGWNPDGYKNKFGPGFIEGQNVSCRPDPIDEFENLEFSWDRVYYNLSQSQKVNEDWMISRYDWSEDANTGLVDFSFGGDFVKANEARDRAVVHGKRLGEIVEVVQPKKVQFIAHSAGTWIARRAAQYLENKFGDNIQTEVTMLDPFVIGNYDEIFDVTSQWADFQENIFVLDAITDNVTLNTSGYYNSWDINLRLDLNNGGGIEYQSFMDDHSGPVYWYAETIPEDGSFRGFEFSLPYEHSLIKPTIENFTPTSPVISINPTFKLYFSKNMQVSTLAGAISIIGSVSGSHTVSGLNYIESEFAVSFGAFGDFTPDETVTVQIATSATDRNNNNLEGNNLTKVYNVLGTTVQPPPPPANAMVFISETIADGTLYNGGDVFTKTWTLKNTGTNTWNSNYCLKHYNGANLGNTTTACVSGTVAPNQQYTFSVNMTAPSSTQANTTYRNNWQLYVGNASFGSSIWVEIIVRGLAAPAFNTILPLDANNIYLAWSALADTNYYRLYKSSSFSGTYTQIMAAASSEYTDTDLTGDATYYYKIKGCFDSQASNCSGLSSTVSARTYPEAGTISQVIQTYNVSSLAVHPADTTLLTSTLYNPSGIAHLNTFKFVYILSDDATLGAGDEILYESDEFVLPNLDTQDFSFNYTIPDAMVIGNHNLLACIIYDPLGSDPATSYCQSKVLVVSASAAPAPSVPNKPTVDYTQGASLATISWNASTGGAFYRLSRATSAAGSYSEIYAGAGFSHVDNSISTGSTYYYKLKSCANSLTNSCSALSDYRSIATSSASANDFFVSNMVLTTTGSHLTVKANQKYSGTSTSIIIVLMGFYLSDDTVCSTSNDTYLGNAQSGLNVNDISDREELTFSLPSFASTGTWYVCAIADYNNAHAESNENNNSESITATTEVAPPRLRPRRYVAGFGIIDVEWDAVPGTVQYRVERGSSPTGPFDEGGYVGTALSYTDGVGVHQNLGECQQVYYRLKSCNGTSDNATCSVSPVVKGYSLAINTIAPTLNVLSDRKIEVSWNQSTCGEYTYVKRTSPLDTKAIYFDKNKESFIDYNYLDPNTTYSYAIAHCFKESSNVFHGNACSSISSFSTATTLLANPEDGIWSFINKDINFSDKTGLSQIVFNNKMWIIGTLKDGVIKNDIWSSDNGISWKEETSSSAFSPRKYFKLAKHNNKLFLIGGLLEDGLYSKQVWSSDNGKNWNLISNDTPYQPRTSTGFISFHNKLWVIGGSGRSLIDGSFTGRLSDIWSSSDDGTSWNLVTSSAAFQERSGSSLIVFNDKLFLIGGWGKTTNSLDEVPVYSDIWSSINGIDWILEDDNPPFGARYNNRIINYNGKLWFLLGSNSVLEHVNLDLNLRYIYNLYHKDNKIWTSTNGINWVEGVETNSLFSGAASLATVYDNKIFVYKYDLDVRYANYGYIPTPPTGNVIIQGSPTSNQLLTADTSGISEQYTIGEYTYQWYINDKKIDGEEGIDFDVGNLTVGTMIKVRARYTNSNGDLQTLFSDDIAVATNPIAINFNQSIIDTIYRETALTNSLLGFDNSYTVVYTSSNTNTASVSGTDETAVVSISGLGSATITATVIDTNGVSGSASFDLTINQADQQINFDASLISLDLIDDDFNLGYTLTGDSTATTLFFSSNSNVVTIDANGYVQLKGAGITFISVSNVGDTNHTPTSATVTLQVTDNFIIFKGGFE